MSEYFAYIFKLVLQEDGLCEDRDLSYLNHQEPLQAKQNETQHWVDS